MKNKSNDWNGKSRGGGIGYRIFLLFIRHLGIKAAYVLLGFVAVYFIPFAPRATRAIWKYNRNILKYSLLGSIWRLYLHYFRFGQVLIDKMAINNGMSDKYTFEFENYEEFLSVIDSGSTIMLGAHVGCWEIGSTFFGDYAHRLNIVMLDNEYQKIKDVIEAQRVPYKIIPINDGGIESLLKIKQALDAQAYVCFQGDRVYDRSQAQEVEFMGAKTSFPLGPTLLASKFKVPVVIYFAMREPNQSYRFKFKVIHERMTQKELMQIYVETLQEVVTAYPQQWFNFYDVWH